MERRDDMSPLPRPRKTGSALVSLVELTVFVALLILAIGGLLRLWNWVM